MDKLLIFLVWGTPWMLIFFSKSGKSFLGFSFPSLFSEKNQPDGSSTCHDSWLYLNVSHCQEKEIVQPKSIIHSFPPLLQPVLRFQINYLLISFHTDWFQCNLRLPKCVSVYEQVCFSSVCSVTLTVNLHRYFVGNIFP